MEYSRSSLKVVDRPLETLSFQSKNKTNFTVGGLNNTCSSAGFPEFFLETKHCHTLPSRHSGAQWEQGCGLQAWHDPEAASGMQL